jgi:hypothetical protein
MKVIDLLNKIANKEEVPKKIEWEDDVYEYDEEEYAYTTYEYERPITLMENVLECDLNKEVEIIEEDKEIKELYHCCMESDNQEIKFLIQNINDLADKTNELIKAVNELKKGK